MSSIVHRFFKLRHPKIFTKRKRTYKKFLGLKTRKAIIYTNRCLGPKDPGKAAKIIKRARPKRTRIKRLIRLKFPNVKLLSPPGIRRAEAMSAQADVANFKVVMSENPTQVVARKKFQAFVPQAV